MTAWLFDTFVATSLLMALVLVVREPIRQRFGAGVAYALWLIPAARLLMPTLTTTVEHTVPAATHNIAPSVPLGFALHQSYAMALAEPTLFERVGGWTGLALTAWLLGAAVMLLRGILVYARQRRAVLVDGVQIASLDGIRVVRSHAVRGPLAFGVIDRVIALPADFEERFDAAQRRLALDHELAHHRAGDLIANHFAYVLLCLQWFNPLAWMSHAAFRFDQEAACDARVLDNAKADDRAVYGQAIAKAASGRALLFSGALDRPSTLQRRLKTMLVTPDPRRRIAGKTLIVATMALALPLTATWATRYVDVPAPPAAPSAVKAPMAPRAPEAPVAPQAALAPAAPLAALAALAPTPPTPPPVPDLSMITNDSVQIRGKTVRWENLTSAQRAQIRAEVAKAKRELHDSHANIERDMASAREEMAKFRNGDFKREMAEARAEMANAIREIDSSAGDIRRAGQNPEKLKAEIRASLQEIENMDIDTIVREALASVDEDRIRASLREAEESLALVERKLNQADRSQ